MTTISYGEERPQVQGANEAAWSQNRRDEFVILEG
jgi:peptidoglycan-associated lipoprotein